MKHSVIILAGGSGSRMNSSTPKQHLLLLDKPVLVYSLLFFEKSFADEIILVVRRGEEAYCQREYVEKYGLQKVTAVTAGGCERFESVWNGLQKVTDADYIWVHDGARPFMTEELLERLLQAAEQTNAVVPGVRVKDTMKQTNAQGKILATVPRQDLWSIQTPQVFSAGLLQEAYTKLMQQGMTDVTDDGMVVERMTNHPVFVAEGEERNIKLTTPEDKQILEVFLRNTEL